MHSSSGLRQALCESPDAHIHLVGIGGAGLSAIARILLERGYVVSGSDLAPGTITDPLRAMGARIFSSHAPEQIEGADLLLVSSAVPENNVEVVAAREQDIPVVRRPEFLGWLTEGYTTVAVAGTHGKTTTTAMIAWILHQSGLDPSYIIGGLLPDLGGNAHAGRGPHFVIEADEYDRTFLGLRPTIGVVTTLEWDHVDCYPSLDKCFDAFASFAELVPADGLLIVCEDGDAVRRLGETRREKGLPTTSYSLEKAADWRAEELAANEHGSSSFQVWHEDRRLGQVALRIPGRHNVANGLAALAATEHLGVAFDMAAEALSRFSGAQRRFEVKGEATGIVVVDDYAHHPTEIRATLAAARQRYGHRRLWVVFQPHTYSRTSALLADFATSFSEADHVIVSEIYPARERDTGLVTSQDLVDEMEHPDAHHIKSTSKIVDYLLDEMVAGDVLITLGAGDGYLVGEQMLSTLREREQSAGTGHEPD